MKPRRLPAARDIEIRLRLLGTRERAILVEGQEGAVELPLARVDVSPASEDGTVRITLPEHLAVEKGLV